jgi:hypothetical protein
MFYRSTEISLTSTSATILLLPRAARSVFREFVSEAAYRSERAVGRDLGFDIVREDLTSPWIGSK